MNYLDAWDRFADLTYADLPEDVAKVAHQCVLDWLGCAQLGSSEPVAQILRDEYAHRSGVCSLVGSKQKLDAATAALVNGAAGHALDFDDTNPAVGCHATAPVLPAALALAEEVGATGAQLIAAFVVGVEVEARIGRIMGVEHYNKGWHTTATSGTFGATAACAHLLKLDKQTYATAMGLAASKAAGVKANFGTMTKPYHAGASAESGVNAARLAARGLTANPNAVYGNQGYVQAAGTGQPFDDRIKNTADRWLIMETLFKYHSACHLTHAAIESVVNLRDQLSVDDLKEVTLTVNPSILDVCGIPEPSTGLEGKFSLRGTTAMAWLGIDTGDPATYVDEVVNRADVQTLLRRVNVETDDALTTFQTRVHCVDNARSSLEAYHDTNVPLRDLGLQQDKLVQKFVSLTGDAQGAARVLNLAEQGSVAGLLG